MKVLVVFIAIMVFSPPVWAGTYTYTSPADASAADDAALAWHAAQNGAVDAKAYFQQAAQSCVAGLVKAHKESRDAALVRQAQSCMFRADGTRTGKSFQLVTDTKTGEPSGLCQ